MKIGMTGGIGAGKSVAASIFEELGFYTIDSDIISHKIMAKDSNSYKSIVRFFGNEILDENNNIDRKKLGQIVFDDKGRRMTLENIVHPEIIAEEKRMRNEIKAKDKDALIITHAPLMVEAGSYKEYDIIIAIYAEEEVRITRVMERDNISALKAKKIIDAQLPEEEKLAVAHIIIDNSQGIKELTDEVKRAANLIKQIVYGVSKS